MAGINEIYTKIVVEQFGLHASWLPGTLVEVGDIGEFHDGAFVRTSSLKAKRFSFKVESKPAPSMRFATQNGVEFLASAKGQTSQQLGAIGKLDAGLKIKFKTANALALVLDPARDRRISDADAVAAWMETQRGKKLKEKQVVVTHVRSATAGVIAMAREAGAEVQLRADADLGKGPISIASVSGKFGLVSSTHTEFVSIPSGRSGMTPMFRVAGYDLPNWFEHVLLGKQPTVIQNKLRAMLPMNDAVALYPATESFG